jgi:hypothetical protein
VAASSHQMQTHRPGTHRTLVVVAVSNEQIVEATHAAQSTSMTPLTFSSSNLTGPGWRADQLFSVPRNARPRWALLTSSRYLLTPNPR